MQHADNTDKEYRLLTRAVHLLPNKFSQRYSEEWHAEFYQLTDKTERRQFAKTAMSMSIRMRLRDIGSYLLGGYGVIRALISWLALVGAFMIFPFFPLLFAPFVLVFLTAAMFYAGTPSQLVHWLMVGSLAIGIISFSYFWWASGVIFEANEAVESAPKSTSFAGESLLLVLASIFCFITSAVYSLRGRKMGP